MSGEEASLAHRWPVGRLFGRRAVLTSEEARMAGIVGRVVGDEPCVLIDW
jgi:hypothetical protein